MCKNEEKVFADFADFADILVDLTAINSLQACNAIYCEQKQKPAAVHRWSDLCTLWYSAREWNKYILAGKFIKVITAREYKNPEHFLPLESFKMWAFSQV